jgi:signal transduction histidine kinase
MKRRLSNFSRRYQAVLRTQLKTGRPAGLQLARGLGDQALAAGLPALDLVRLHEETLLTVLLPGCPAVQRNAIIKQAAVFFALAATPAGASHSPLQPATARVSRFIETLSQRTVELAAANLELSREVVQRKTAEAALKKSEHHYSLLLDKSDRLQEQLRQLSRQILSAQEEERKAISRELHDVIAQTLTGINVRLATLSRESATSSQGLDRNIARTRRLVEQSVEIVHQFARELRPAVLDDLGLVPALHSFMKHFTTRTGVRTHLTAFAGVEQLETARRTVLFRVAQEALNNVARHAKASHVKVTLQKTPGGIRMKIKDDGKSFQVERVFGAMGGKRLGLLGMRERLEMVGGKLGVDSAPGTGTTITAQIPLGRTRAQK